MVTPVSEMTQEKSNPLDNNIFVLRFQILYEYYRKYFYNNQKDFNIIDTIQDKYNLTPVFLFNNLTYLRETGYINESGLKVFGNYDISFKGIKFVEEITDGKLDYDISNNDVSLIRRKFSEGDTLPAPKLKS